MARDLNIRITADNTDAVQKLGQTEAAIGGVEKKGGLLSGALDKVGGFAGAARMALAGLGTAGVGIAVQQLTSLTSELKDMADQMNVSVEAVQRWKFAAEQTGGTLDGLAGSAQFLFKQLGNPEAKESVVGALQMLGLSLEEVRAMKPEQAFELIADRVGALKNPFEQAHAGATLLSRGFASNLPAMKEGIGNLGDEAARLGLIMKEDTVKAGEAFGDTVNQLKGALMSLIGSALGPLIPVLTELLKALLPVAKLLGELVNLVLTPLGWALTKVAEGIGWVITKLADLIKPTAWLKAAWEGIVYVFTTARDAIVGTVKAIWEGINYWMVQKFGDTVQTVKGLVESVGIFYKNLWINVVGRSYVPDMIDAIAYQFGRLPQVMVQPVSEATKHTEDAFRQMLTRINNQFTEWGNSLGGWIQNTVPGMLGQGLGSVASGLLNGVMGLFTGGLNQLVQMGVDLAWKGLKKLGSMIAGLFRGEGARTNDLRDEWMAGLGGLNSAHQLIGSFGNDWTLLNAFEKAYFASTRDDFTRWVEVFQRRLSELQGGALPNPNAPTGGGSGGGAVDPRMPEGGGNNYIFNNPQFSDRASIDDLTRRVGNAIMADLTMRMRFAQ